ncbi:signal recognition particle-docking protein FtsY [Denitrificimonas caeni]|uniref:signal recognition particle-docking protein FtsY n=1 Tax=Denitrificimonas caeni TaxID=521720 RepID=UPI0019626E5D|nr:signal recognition particle-docking protein FtsY [Denitrificimonas caeni]
MFGSGDDKKSKKPASSADSVPSTDSQADVAAPAKKGLFSWFGRKKTEPKAEQSSAVEPTPAAEPEQSVTVEPSVVEADTEQMTASVAEAEDCELPVEPEVLVSVEPLLVTVEPETVAVVELESAPVLEPQDQESYTAVSTEVAPADFAQSERQDTLVPAPAPAPAAEPKSTAVVVTETAVIDADVPALAANLAGQSKPQGNKVGWFARLKQGLSKTSSSLGEGMASLFLGKKEIDDDLLEELETRLLTADVGMEATAAIMGNLTRRVARKELADSGALYQALQVEMAELLRPVEQPLSITANKKPYVILVVGVNGAGKTTTIGKMASRLQKEGKKVMLAAGDTFRAAAVEQLQVWGERNKIPVIAQHTGADSASVIFDAVQAAQSRGVDVLIADTAGRLHTKDNLMEELRKVARVMSKLDDSAPHEVLLVLDAGTGQNAINQTRQFNQTIPLTGLALTKLDGTAKGGVIFALAKHFSIPVRYIGVGEGIDDLRDFVADDFVKALFAEKDSA